MKSIVMVLYYHSPIDGRVYYKEAQSLATLKNIKNVYILFKSNKMTVYDTGGVVRGCVNDWNSKNKKIKFIPYKSYLSCDNLFTKIIDRLLVHFIICFNLIKLNDRIDIIHIHENIPVISASIWAKKIINYFYNKSIPIIYDVHENHILLFSEKIPFSKKYFTFKEKSYLKSIDKIITVSEKLLKYYSKLNSQIDSEIVYNSKHLNKNSKNKCNFENKIIVHEGSLGVKRGSRYLQRIMNDVAKENKDVKLRILGNLNDSKIKNEDWIDVKGWVEYEKLDELLCECSIGINYIITENAKFGVPNKFFGYLAAGLPIVTLEGSESALILEKYKLGIVVSKELINESVSQILEILKCKETWNIYSNNCINTFTNVLCWEKQAVKLFSIYRDYL